MSPGGFSIVEIDGVPATPSGQLPVVSTPPQAPPGTEPVDLALRADEGNVSRPSPQELAFPVPVGKRLTILWLAGASETSIGGARVDLLFRDAGDERIAAPLFLNGATQQINLGRTFTAGAIVLRRTNMSGAPVYIYAEWDGFLEDAL